MLDRISYLAKFGNPQFRFDVLRTYFEAGAEFEDAFQISGLHETEREIARRDWIKWELYEAA